MRILISDKDSYIGDNIGSWLLASNDVSFQVDYLDVRFDSWKEFDFSGFDEDYED